MKDALLRISEDKAAWGTRKKTPRPGMGFPAICLVCAAVLLLMIVGCGGRSAPAVPQMTLNIEAEADANAGKVFYVVVRSTLERQYFTATYADIAGIVFADPPDASMLGAFPVFPGKDQAFTVKQPDQNPVAFYFLFTEPSEYWRQIVPQPLAKAYYIEIAGNTVIVREKKSFWAWLFGG